MTDDLRSKISAILDTLGEKKSIKIEFKEIENNFFIWNQDFIFEEKVFLPNIASQHFISSYRASIDMALCYLLFHNKPTHKLYRDDKNYLFDEEKIIFDFLEKIRVMICVKKSYIGIIKNILEKITEDIANNFDSKIPHLPLYLGLLKEVFGFEVYDFPNKKIEKKISLRIKKLTKNFIHQEAFAIESISLIKILKLIHRNDNVGKSPKPKLPSALETTGLNQCLSNIKRGEIISAEKNHSTSECQQPFGINHPQEFDNEYKVFTSEFDEIIFPQKFIERSELQNLRSQLELRLKKLTKVSHNLIIKLQKKLLAKKNFVIKIENVDGILDRKKLSQIVANKRLDDIWIYKKHDQYKNTIVTILLDNSGSMRGNPIMMSAMACEIISKILEKFSIKTEIIGFTTVDWKGGRSRKLWESKGAEKNPGRINDVRHIVYKSSHQKFSRTKVNLGLMLKEGILKENIDGEALLLAKSRMSRMAEEKKILAVISDGAPIDDSTISNNNPNILSYHLKSVIQSIEAKNKIKIFGIGIGHDVKNFYKNSISIKSTEELGDTMVDKITQLL
jgi:hypothetical protein